MVEFIIHDFKLAICDHKVKYIACPLQMMCFLNPFVRMECFTRNMTWHYMSIVADVKSIHM